MNERVRKFISGIIVGAIIFGSISFYAELTKASAPSITYASPSNGATFVNVWRGHGVNVTVNVTDADGDLNKLVLKWNDSGTWKTFYSNTTLGGVSYHNVTVLNSNFTGSWTTYQWQICAYDTSWTNTTYEFTTGYIWGDPILVRYDNFHWLDYPCIIKYDNKYALSYLDINTSKVYSVNVDNFLFVNDPNNYVEQTASKYFTYMYIFQNKLYSVFVKHETHGADYNYWYHIVDWNGTSWTNDTAITDYYLGSSTNYRPSVIYYNGLWNTFYSSTWIYGNSPFHGTRQSISSGSRCPSSAILDGKLILVFYSSNDNKIHWKTYDGVSWSDKGAIDYGSIVSSIVKDPVNNQIILVYYRVDTKYMYYRILTDPDGTWSEPHEILYLPSDDITFSANPFVSYIDHRVVIVFTYDKRGTRDIYMITAPEYLSNASGILKQYNRIRFPDATPNQKNVNSSVFYFENINSRNITWINWSFSDIGSIQCENNIRLWGSTDNSTWTAIGTTDANGYINMTTTTWAGGLPWQAGIIRYFKLEILDVGDVPEDLHSNDAEIVLKVGLA